MEVIRPGISKVVSVESDIRVHSKGSWVIQDGVIISIGVVEPECSLKREVQILMSAVSFGGKFMGYKKKKGFLRQNV